MVENFDIEFVELAKKLGFNPTFLKEIIRMRGFGYNNTEIANMTGISRVTVNNYIEKLKRQENQQAIGKLILFVIGIYLGTKILEEIFK